MIQLEVTDVVQKEISGSKMGRSKSQSNRNARQAGYRGSRHYNQSEIIQPEVAPVETTNKQEGVRQVIAALKIQPHRENTA